MEMPPLGLRPRIFAVEARLLEVAAAIGRYQIANHPIPQEWWDEYEEIVEYLRRHRVS